MGTTSDALQTGSAQIAFVLAIEGYENLLTDHGNAAAVTTAWSLTGFTGCLPGCLKVNGRIRQAIEPWQNDLDVPTLTFAIQPDDADTFGRDVSKTKPTFRTQLTGVFEPAQDGSGTLPVRSTAAFPGSGRVYMGNRAVDYVSTGASQFTLDPGGAMALSLFSADGLNHYARTHEVSAQELFDSSRDSWVQDVPPTWIGRRVALYLHRIVAGVLDAKAQAQLEFAGRIVSIEDSPDGQTVLNCEDVRAEIRDCTLLKRQWSGYVKPGIKLQVSDEFALWQSDGGGEAFSDPLVVVASGAAGTSQLNAGYYDIEEFVNRLNRWASNDPNLDGIWRFEILATDGGRRLSISRELGAPSDLRIAFFSSTIMPAEFLGFREQVQRKFSEGLGGYWFKVFSEYDRDTAKISIVSQRAPYRVKPFHSFDVASLRNLTVDVENKVGVWIEQTAHLPAPYDSHVTSSDTGYGFVKIGDLLYFARYDGTDLTHVSIAQGFAGFASNDGNAIRSTGLTLDDEGDHLMVQQVVVLADSFSELFTKLLASTGGSHPNHATYDVFDSALGCPGIPWSLLGDSWLHSIRDLDQALTYESSMVVLDRPTKLVDLLVPELALRFAWLVFDPVLGQYRLSSPPTPNSLTAEHVLTEDNKAGPVRDMANSGAFDARVQESKEFLRNVVKISYNKGVDGKFQDHWVVKDAPSIAEYGESQVVTVEAPNSYSGTASTGAPVEDLGATLVARVFPMFGRPMKVVTRTIAPSLYHMVPGDTVSLSDDRIRNQVTGERGLVGRACVCLAVTHDYGSEQGELYGEVTLLLTDEDRTFPYSPCVEVDTSFSGSVDGITFTDGYANTAAGGPALKVREHAHSLALQNADASYLGDGYLVRIVEIDPEDVTSPAAWNRTLASSGAVDDADGYVRLASDLSSPSYDSALLYRIVPQLFTAVQDSQEGTAFLAAAGDGLVIDAAQPNLYGDENNARSAGFTKALPSAQAVMIPDEALDEGRPLHPGLVADLMATVNNLISYRATAHMPFVWDQGEAQTNDTNFVWCCTFPFPVGGIDYKTTKRKLVIAPILQITTSSSLTATLRVTSSKFHPQGPTDELEDEHFVGPTKSVTFTRTGAITADEVTAQELEIVPAGDFTWLTVELKTSNAVGQARFHGFAQLYLGEVRNP